MTTPLPALDLRSLPQWRRWLTRHHASSPGVWLVFHKGHTGVKSMSIEDAGCEALCFGWIDSLIRRLDEDRYAVKVTPRRPDSRWSDVNRKRWAALKAAGRLAPAGLAAAPTDHRYAPKPVVPELPGYLARALRARPKAWRFFRELAPGYRRAFVVWIHLAKRPQTRDKRIRESIALLTAGKRLGLK